MPKRSIAIIGAGKVGSALAILLHQHGYNFKGVASKSFESAHKLAKIINAPAYELPAQASSQADIVFITTPDRHIDEVAAALSENDGFHQGQFVFHTSGSLTSEVLLSAKKAGACIGSIHPLQSFADINLAVKSLAGSYFALDGDDEAIELAQELVAVLGGQSFIVPPEKRPIYHAAACTASNYLVALLHQAAKMFEQFGLSQSEAFAALAPLIYGTLHNISSIGITQALTGPISRGDAATVQAHLSAFNKSGINSDMYCSLAQYTILVALEKGSIDNEQAADFSEILTKFTEKQ